jgi:hypothetical protein
MSSKSLASELEAIQAIISESPAGIGIAELEAAVTQRLKAKLVRCVMYLFGPMSVHANAIWPSARVWLIQIH